ncbi:hypothetical protein CHUAL_001938 [Chamberlinius hualienensis]
MMAVVETIFVIGILLTIAVTLFQCIRCKESERKPGESINNNDPQGQSCNSHNGDYCDSEPIYEDPSRPKSVRKLPEIPNSTRNGSQAAATVEIGVVNHENVSEGRSSSLVEGAVGNHVYHSAHQYARIHKGQQLSEEKDTDTDTYEYPKMYPNGSGNSQSRDSDSIYEAPPPPVPEKRYDSPEPSTSGHNHNNSQSITSAASAVAGRASAADIPLITPMIQSNQDLYNSSQVSDGYTRISVREPLNEIRSRTRYPEAEPQYSDVPDDLDKMYAEIDSAQNSRNSSESYSTISRDVQTFSGDIPPLPPPLESLRSAAQAHSRQASLSSFVSDSGAVAGPSSHSSNEMEDMYSKIDKSKKSRTTVHMMESGVGISGNRNDEGDIYAQVHKPSRRTTASVKERQGSATTSRYSFATHSSSSREGPRKSSVESSSSAVVRRSSSKDDPGYEKIRETHWNRLSTNLELENPIIDNDYEIVRTPKGSFRDYETIRKYSRSMYDNEEAEPGYEEVHQNHNIEVDLGPSDAGYEIVGESPFNRSDPNYESLRYESVPQASSAVAGADSTYWQIQNGLTAEGEAEADPLYEKINNEDYVNAGAIKHGYEKIKRKKQNSECESVTSVEQPDPGYETISNNRTSVDQLTFHWNSATATNVTVTTSLNSPPYVDMRGDIDSSNRSFDFSTNFGGSAAFDDSDSLL